MENFSLKIDEDLKIIIPEFSMAEAVYDLIDSDRINIGKYLDFIPKVVNVDSEKDYFRMKLAGQAKGTDRLFFISYDNKIVGCIDLHKISSKNKSAEIGYWMHHDYTGKNIMTRVVKKLSGYCFNTLKLNKLTIYADVKNIASNKVAKKAGFKFSGTKLEDVVIYDQFRDMNEYYLLKNS